MKIRRRRQQGAAIFVAMLILLSLSIVAMSSMARTSESSYLAGKDIEKKRLFLMSESAVRIALANLGKQVKEKSTPPSPASPFLYVSADNVTQGTFILFPDNTNPVFAYRATANLLAAGPTNFKLPGSSAFVPKRTYCFDVVVDTKEIIYITGTVSVNNDGADVLPAGYHYGETKSTGVISCLKK